MKAATNLILIKSIHTLIWIIFVVTIGFVLWSGISANISIYSWLGVGAVLIEVLVLAIFRGSCPLTKIARRYSNSKSDNFDIYLPAWLAKYNKQIFGTLFLIGLALMVYQVFFNSN